jgi:hypothetical protein
MKANSGKKRGTTRSRMATACRERPASGLRDFDLSQVLKWRRASPTALEFQLPIDASMNCPKRLHYYVPGIGGGEIRFFLVL